MLSSYLAAAWRSACREPLHTVLNIFGLALGFAAALLIGAFVTEELSYNSFLPGYRDVYWLKVTIAGAGQQPVTSHGTPATLAADLSLEFPEIIATARTIPQTVDLRRGSVERSEDGLWADADFLMVMRYKLIRGNPATALAEPDSLVLTRALATAYFGTLDCLGQTLEVNRYQARVTGVLEDVPVNATEHFGLLVSGKTRHGKLAMIDATPTTSGVLTLPVRTFVRLRPDSDPAALASRFPAFARAHYPDPDGPGALFASLFLHSLADVHLRPYNPDTGETSSREQAIYAAAVVGIAILFLAGVNFVSLVTARATHRAVEVGIRKALGATRGQLFVQFMGESVICSLGGLLGGLGFAGLFVPILDAFLERRITFGPCAQPLLFLLSVPAAIAFGLASGAYPAVVLARFPPAQVLQSRGGSSVGGGKLRTGLIVAQSTVMVSLIIVTIVIDWQTSFATSRALVFDKDLVLTVDLTGLPESSTPDGLGRREAAPVEALRARLTAVPGIRAMAATFNVPLMSNTLRMDYAREGQSDQEAVNATVQPVDVGYFGVYAVPLLAGRDFSRHYGEDRLGADNMPRVSSAIINEAALRALGFASPSAAIGKEIRSLDPATARRHRIIGVAPDFPLESVRDPVPPTVFVVDPGLFKVLSLKLDGTNLAGTLRAIDGIWRESVPERPVDRVFLDDRIAGLYLELIQEGHLLVAATAFAIAIGGLGLIGLASYTAERCIKEIGVRKALGASSFDIGRLLIGQLGKPVLLAVALAWPVAWWIARWWLEGFAYHINLGPLPFLGASLAAIVLSAATMGLHMIRIVRLKPASALRCE